MALEIGKEIKNRAGRGYRVIAQKREKTLLERLNFDYNGQKEFVSAIGLEPTTENNTYIWISGEYFIESSSQEAIKAFKNIT